METTLDNAGASLDELKVQAKKASTKAMNLKMELHDLSEELPLGWEKIPEVAQRAHAAFETLIALKAKIAALEN